MILGYGSSRFKPLLEAVDAFCLLGPLCIFIYSSIPHETYYFPTAHSGSPHQNCVAANRATKSENNCYIPAQKALKHLIISAIPAL